MKKLTKKGFTLIELLAVIVVLAILLVIAVPRVLDVIESARSESLGKSAQIVARYLKQDYAIKMVRGTAPTAAIVSPGVACPAEAGHNAAEGGCLYTMSLSGSEASFTVIISGLGRFARWRATSVDGATPTIVSYTPTP